jgi:hypothetical protein
VAYRVLVTGSRDWIDRDVILNAFSGLPFRHGTLPVVVHGDCKGADRLAELVAERVFGWKTEGHPAIWRPNGIYNPQAGLLRNRKMVELGADICLAFIKNGSRGATHCAGLAEEAGIPTRRFTA